MRDLQAASHALVAAGARLTDTGILVSVEGNLSVRLSDGRCLTTPTGRHKGDLEPEDLVLTDPRGRTLGTGDPSSELPLHVAIYGTRPDVRAIVHAHPRVATAFAVAGRDLPTDGLAEAVVALGVVPTVPFRPPSTTELAATAAAALRDHEALLLAHHGAVTVGPELGIAVERMVQLEHVASIALIADLLGGARRLTADDVGRLRGLVTTEPTAVVPEPSPSPPVRYPSSNESGTITLTQEELVGLVAEAIRTIRS